jgi:hypothetical protein
MLGLREIIAFNFCDVTEDESPGGWPGLLILVSISIIAGAENSTAKFRNSISFGLRELQNRGLDRSGCGKSQGLEGEG